MGKWTKEDFEIAIFMLKAGNRYKEIGNAICKKSGTVKRMLERNGYSYEEEQKITNMCLCCGKELKTTKSRNRKFCNNSCSAKYNNKQRILKKGSKQVLCIDCGAHIEIDNRVSPKWFFCKKCKSERKYLRQKRKCKVCGSANERCKRPDICKKHQVFPSLIKYFGFDEKKLGTELAFEEFERVKSMLIEDYITNELSTIEMVKKYNHNNDRNFTQIMDSLNIDRRSISDAGILAYMNGKSKPPTVAGKKYKSGWHMTWDNKKIFYRSSYELEYAQELDKQRVEYEVEKLRISYWDSQKCIQRTAIPDFYLIKTNMIIEIKSEYTYNEQNMKDKYKSYKEHGYKFKLILEKEEVNISSWD